EIQAELLNSLSFGDTYTTEIVRVSTVGPSIGSELKTKALWAILAVSVATVVFIAFVFRKVSQPVSSWIYGMVAIITLLHDIIIPTGFYALFGEFGNWQMDVLFVMALLAILGLSINDTIVVFDRIRENLALNKEKNPTETFAETVDRSLRETFSRSFNTSFTSILVLSALYFLGSESTKHFAFALGSGMIAGTYSSLFLASPLLVYWAGKKASWSAIDIEREIKDSEAS